MALLCYGNGTLLDMAAIAHMCKLCVLINHGNTFLEPRYFTDPQLSNCLEQLTTLHARCSMATRLPELVSALESRPEYLTSALREVSSCTMFCEAHDSLFVMHDSSRMYHARSG